MHGTTILLKAVCDGGRKVLIKIICLLKTAA
jgi:hypothetical protein